MKRIPELDGIRALAALSIALFHLAPGYLPLGWSAVDCFFVLSGFLITTILLRNRGDSQLLLHFYARRSLRIWPIYYITLVFLLIVGGRIGRLPSLGVALQYLTYTQNVQRYFYSESRGELFSYFHTWTLAVEEQYYLIWPLVVLLVGKRVLAAASVGLLVVCLVLRYLGLPAILLLTRGDGFALGSLLAIVLSGTEMAFERRRLILGFVLSIALSLGGVSLILGGSAWRLGSWAQALESHNDELISWVCLFYFGAIGLVVCFNGSPFLAFLRVRPPTYIGQISYGLYLYHVVVENFTEWVFRRNTQVDYALGGTRPLWRSGMDLAISLIIAVVSWHLIEKPILSLKDRFKYNRSRDEQPRTGPPVTQPLTSPTTPV